MVTILIAGGTGFIGTALTSFLRGRGDDVRLLVRRPSQAPYEYRWDPAAGHVPPAALEGVHSIVNLSGAPVAQRWTRAGRQSILASRVDATSTLAHAIARLPDGTARPALLQGSAIGYYGERGELIVREDGDQGAGFLAEVVHRWEEAAEPARRAGAVVSYARTGIVLSQHGGALARLLPLVKLGLAGPLGSGRQWWSWISLRDEVAALAFLIDTPRPGPFNLVSPGAARCREVVRALAAAAHRPAFLPVPGWALRLAIGGFAGEILASAHVSPARLTKAGFEFRDTDLQATARQVLS